MMRRGARAVVSNQSRLWGRLLRGNENFIVGTFQLSSTGLEDLHLRTIDQLQGGSSQHLPWQATQQFTGRRVVSQFYIDDLNPGSYVHQRQSLSSDQKGWTVSPKSSQAVGYHQGDCLPSTWRSSKLERDIAESTWLVKPWKSEILRMLSTKPHGDAVSHSSEEKEAPTEETQARPKTLADFKHEEIEGPTVDRDLSDTADQLRGSVGELRTFMNKLSKGFLALGSVQLAAAFWSSYIQAGLIVGLSHNLGFVLSFVLAYLLHHFGSAVEFFSKIEERSRLRVLTLSLQVVKALATLLYRSNFVVTVVSISTLLVLIGDLFHSL